MAIDSFELIDMKGEDHSTGNGKDLEVMNELPIPTFIDGLGLGDHDAVHARVWEYMKSHSKSAQTEMIASLVWYVERQPDCDEAIDHILNTAKVLVGFARFDPAIIDFAVFDHCLIARAWLKRVLVAYVIEEMAHSGPVFVPLDIVARLARPSEQEWYVQEAALNCAEELLPKRPEAIRIFEDLSLSKSADDREFAISRLLRVRPRRSKQVDGIVQRLLRDPETRVSGMAQELSDSYE